MAGTFGLRLLSLFAAGLIATLGLTSSARRAGAVDVEPTMGPLQYGQDVFDAGDYSNFSIPRPDPQICLAACRKDDRCEAVAYTQPGTYGNPQAACWLKARTGRFGPHANAISAVKYRGVSSAASACGTALSPPLFEKWSALARQGRPLGCPIAPETSTPAATIAVFNGAEGPSVVAAMLTGPRANQGYFVIGCFYSLYRQHGGPTGWLGMPTGDGFDIPGGAQQEFDGGTMRWDRATGQCAASNASPSPPPLPPPAPTTAAVTIDDSCKIPPAHYEWMQCGTVACGDFMLSEDGRWAGTNWGETIPPNARGSWVCDAPNHFKFSRDDGQSWNVVRTPDRRLCMESGEYCLKLR